MRIGELAQASGKTAKTLRFYEESGLLPPPERSPAGYRDYAADSIGRIAFITRSQRAGLTLAQIREVLTIRDGGTAPCAHVQELLAQQLASLDKQIAELLELRRTVVQLHTDAASIDPAGCDPGSVCRYL